METEVEWLRAQIERFTTKGWSVGETPRGEARVDVTREYVASLEARLAEAEANA